MSIFKRLSATLVSRLDQVVGGIENHDAVIQVTLIDMCQKVAEAKVRLAQVHSEAQQLEQQIKEQKENAALWRKRAIECATTDETKALECVARKRIYDEKSNNLEIMLARYAQAAVKLAQDIETSEQRLSGMKQKLTLMRARQSTSKALGATNETNHYADIMLDESFNRWEISIGQSEMATDIGDNCDNLERDFLSQEQHEALQKELSMLLAEEQQK